jgi:2-C-methyl-D-erythritol 2,4-cyclodiphosphate synthase
MMIAEGFEIANADMTIIAQVPRLAPHQAKMRTNLATLLEKPEELVNLKVTSTDGLGAFGREEGIAALAVVLLQPAVG